VRIATWNINSVRLRAPLFAQLEKQAAPDIVCLQETIANLSGLVTLAPGDLIYTGTPDGVGPVLSGDKMHGHIDGLSDIEITVK